MTNPRTLPLLLALPFSIVFSWVFWEEKAALNLVFFGTLLGGVLLALHPAALKNWKVLALAGGNLLAGSFVLLHASTASVIAYFLTFLVFSGQVVSPHFRSLPAALLAALSQFTALPRALFETLGSLLPRKLTGGGKLRVLRLFVIPAGVCLVFLLIFAEANPKFSAVIDWSTSWMSDLFDWSFSPETMARLVFTGFGFVVAAAFLFQEYYWPILYADLRARENLVRKRRFAMRRTSPVALRKEYRSALILLAMVNLLILVNNVIDIHWLWFNFEVEDPYELYQFVHEGTFLLILSILLSMGIMFYFFRGNLNFLSRNKWLRYGSYLWIAQNLVLVVSVMVRNYHYISYWSLTHKRIGVIVFLVMTAVGLVTLALKIKDRKTPYRVIRLNARAAYLCLIFLAAFDWDGYIARYNLRDLGREGLDLKLLLELSDRTLPILEENRAAFKGKYVTVGYWEILPAEEMLDDRIGKMLERHERRSFWSWSVADQRAHRQLAHLSPKPLIEASPSGKWLGHSHPTAAPTAINSFTLPPDAQMDTSEYLKPLPDTR